MSEAVPVSEGKLGAILVATGNPGKAKEFAEIFAAVGVRALSLKDVPGVSEPEESGKTFLANALIKARAYALATKMPTLADDSGLEVDALGGEPGVESAYYAERNGVSVAPERAQRDPANNAMLLGKLEGVPDERRTARFVCTLALVDALGRTLVTTRGTVEGKILRAPRGANGFGYDPLFLVDGSDKTSAEMSSEEKHAVSHRGRATREMVAMMRSTGLV